MIHSYKTTSSAPQQDESDAPTKSQIYIGLGWTKDLLVMRSHDVTADSKLVFEALKSLVDAFERQSMVGVKNASDALCVASSSLQITARKINDDSAVLARKAREHLNRRTRI